MDMQEMFNRIAKWEADEQAKNPFTGTNKGVDWGRKVAHKFHNMRTNAIKTAFNAEQFNRRSDFKRRNPHIDPAQVDAMFPASH